MPYHYRWPACPQTRPLGWRNTLLQPKADPFIAGSQPFPPSQGRPSHALPCLSRLANLPLLADHSYGGVNMPPRHQPLFKESLMPTPSPCRPHSRQSSSSAACIGGPTSYCRICSTAIQEAPATVLLESSCRCRCALFKTKNHPLNAPFLS